MSHSIENANRKVKHTIGREELIWKEKYEILEKIGQGQFGVVYKVKSRLTGLVYACKIVDKIEGGQSMQAVNWEVKMLKSIRHPNVISGHEIIELPRKLYLVQELCNAGGLADVLKCRGRFDEKSAVGIIAQLLSAISYLHRHGYVHRDLKLENILCCNGDDDSSEKIIVKIGDFGLATRRGGTGTVHMLDGFCGTPHYMAPEIVENKTYSEKCDIWSLGIVTSLLLTCEYPFKKKIAADQECAFEGKPWLEISLECKDFIFKCVRRDPALRATADELLKHPWIMGFLMKDVPHRPDVITLMKEFNRSRT